jgi:hypothetical protein
MCTSTRVYTHTQVGVYPGIHIYIHNRAQRTTEFIHESTQCNIFPIF